MDEFVKELVDELERYKIIAHNQNLYLDYLFEKHPNDLEEVTNRFSGAPGYSHINIVGSIENE